MRDIKWDEWMAKGTALYGEKANWAFKCPACGRVNTMGEFASILGTEKMYQAAFKCIGRVNGLGVSGMAANKKNLKIRDKAQETGCDWAAGGLFRTLGKGYTVIDNGGDKTDVFPFACEVENAEAHGGENDIR